MSCIYFSILCPLSIWDKYHSFALTFFIIFWIKYKEILIWFNFYTKYQQEINHNNDISYTVTLKQLCQSSSNTNISDLSGFWLVADFEFWDLPLNLVLRGASNSSCLFCKPLSAMCWAWVASSKQWGWANCSYPRGNGFSHNIQSFTDLKTKEKIYS